MVANGKHLLYDRKFCGRNVLVIDEGEQEGFVRGNISPLHGSLTPRDVTEPTTDLSMLTLGRGNVWLLLHSVLRASCKAFQIRRKIVKSYCGTYASP